LKRYTLPLPMSLYQIPMGKLLRLILVFGFPD